MAGRSRCGTAAAALASLLVLSACGGGRTGGTPTVTPSAGGNAGGAVKLAFIGPLSGAHSDLGFAVRDGARVAVQQAKDSGVKVDLVEGDTQGDPAQASAIKGRFINDPGVVGVVGPSLSDETRTLLPDLEANNLAMVSASASDVALPTVVPNEAVFHRVVPDDTAAAAGIASYIVKEVKPHSVVYVNDSSDYGRGLADATMKAVAATGIPGQPLTIDPNTQDLAPVLANIKAANPDLVFYGGYVSNAGALVKRLRDIGVTAKFISGEGALDPGFVTTAGAPAAEGAIFACSCRFPAADAGGALGRFATQYAQINNGAPLDAYSAEGYDAANVLINGIKAGDTDRTKLLQYVDHYPSTPGVAKTIAFQNNGDIQDSGVMIYKVINSKITVVGPN